MFTVLSPFVLVLVSSSASAEPTDAELAKRLADLDQDAVHRSELSGPLENARRALEQSRHDAKGAQWAPPNGATDRHANLLRALAGEWLDVARDLVRTVDAEKAANAALKALDDAQTKIVRGKLLLEETIARRGRSQAQLEALDKAKTETPAQSPAAPHALPTPAPASSPSVPSAAPPGSAAPAKKAAPPAAEPKK